jgi:phage-related protein
MNAWIPRLVSLPLAPTTVGASQTNVAVSKRFAITAGGSTNMVVAIKTSSVTAGAGITAKLRTSIGDNTAVDSKTASITADGIAYIKLNVNISANQTYLPLLSIGEVVLTTGAGSTATIEAVWVLQED